jgi:hypothetical protein
MKVLSRIFPLRTAFSFAAVLSLLPASAGTARAQASPAPSAQNAAQDAAPAPKPAPEQAPQKKVWTNDEVGAPRGPAGDTVPQTRNSNSAAQNATSRSNSKGKDAKWYHDQIAKLQAKIPPLDEEIAQLQAAIDGSPTGDSKTSARPRGVKSDSWADELEGLKKERDDISNKIAALQDEARHNGVPPNALP